MPVRELIGHNRLSDINLLPHLRSKSLSNNVNLENFYELQNYLIWECICGEDIDQYKLVAIDNNSLYLADNNELPAIGIALDGGRSGNIIRVTHIAVIRYDNTFTSTDLFLQADGLFDTTIPEAGIIQKVGQVISPEFILISISDPIYLEV